LLHGSVRRDKNSVRVTARLIDDTGYQVWSETFDRKLEGIFAIQSEIANTVASRVEREIVPPAELPAGRTTTNMEAYDAFLVGRSFVNARTAGWQDEAIAAYEKAIRLDENYAAPYAGLAVALLINNRDWADVHEFAVRAAQTAIELDPELAEGYAALGLALSYYPENGFERSEQPLRRALDLDPTLSNAYNWLSISLRELGRLEEAVVVQDRGLIVDPLNPALSANIAGRLLGLGERERAEQLLLRLTYLPDPPAVAVYSLARLYADTGEFDKSLHWAKEAIRAFKFQLPDLNAYLAGRYERLGLTEDADYWAADALMHTPQPELRFFYKAWQNRIRGDLAGVRAEIEELRTALGPGIDELQGDYAAAYATANIAVADFDAGIDAFENAFDFESLSIFDALDPWAALNYSHALAYAYQQVGREEEANMLLNRLREQLNEFIVEQNMNFGPVHHVLALNLGLRGDFDAAADALEDAIEAGWLRYIWVMSNPEWAETIANPRIARMLEGVKVELERQRAVVEQADAEHDFRAEFAAMRSALQD
jgi:tetratricopeptide (TPR) repeat protein